MTWPPPFVNPLTIAVYAAVTTVAPGITYLPVFSYPRLEIATIVVSSAIGRLLAVILLHSTADRMLQRTESGEIRWGRLPRARVPVRLVNFVERYGPWALGAIAVCPAFPFRFALYSVMLAKPALPRVILASVPTLMARDLIVWALFFALPRHLI
jgi:hypothetical protein